MIAWATQALLASALLMVLVLALRRGVARVFGARVAYALWALPALRLILPPLPAWHTAAPLVRAGKTIVVVGDAPAPTMSDVALSAALPTIWVIGAVAFLAWHLVAYARFRRTLLTDAVALDAIERVRVVASPAATGPLALGLYDRIVALPTDDRYDADERTLALAHERMHHARGDLYANWVALVVLAVHWFDPIAWIAYRAFRADQERACDADVLARQGRECAHTYARAIVKAAHGRAVSPVCHLNTVTDLKGRLKMLKLSPISRRRMRFGGVSVAALMLASLCATASNGTATVEIARSAAVVSSAPVAPVPPIAATPVVPAVAPEPAAPAKSARRQVRTIIVRPGSKGASVLLLDNRNADRPGNSTGAMILPRAFEVPGTCGSDASGLPEVSVIKGEGGDKSYTVLCSREPAATANSTGTGPMTERDTYTRALASLRALRGKV